MIVTICIIVLLYFLLFFLFIKEKEEEKKAAAIEIKKDSEIKKVEKEKVKQFNKSNFLLFKTIEMFKRVFEDAKCIENFVVFNPVTREKTIVDLLLLSKKGLFVVNTKVIRDGIVYLKSLDDFQDWKICSYDKNYTQIIKTLKSPLEKIDKQIKALESLDLKYHYYFEPLVIFSRNTKVRKPYIDDKMQHIIADNIVIAEQKLKQLNEEEEDLFTQDKIDYLYNYLIQKKID